jgi:hypothetical protein
MSELLDSHEYRAWHADVLRLYQAFFNRTPDTGGAAYWIDKYEDGSSLDDIAWGFSNSTEFQNQYGSTLANSEFLTIVYSNVLGRAPDQEGFNYWLGQMNGGLTQHGVVRWVVANQEFITNYPFSATAAPLADYLLSIKTLAGTTGEISVTRTEGPHDEYNYDECTTARVWPKNSELVAFDLVGEKSLFEFGYEFSTVAAAEAFVNKTKQIPTACASYQNYAVSEIAVPALGHDVVGHHFIDRSNRSGSEHWKQIVIRIDRLVIYVIVVANLPTSVDEVVQFATLATDHAISSAG